MAAKYEHQTFMICIISFCLLGYVDTKKSIALIKQSFNNIMQMFWDKTKIIVDD